MEENKELQNQNPESEKELTQAENAQSVENAEVDHSTETEQKEDVESTEAKADQVEVVEESVEQSTAQAENELTTTEPTSEEKPAESQVAEANESQAETTEEKPAEEDVITLEKDENIYGDTDHLADEEAEEEHFDHITEEFLNDKSREEILDLLKEVVQIDDVNKVKGAVALIRSSFIQLTKDKKQADYEQFVAKGIEGEEFVEQPDELEIHFNDVFGVYRKKKAEQNRSQEEIKKQNLEKKNEILEKLRELISSEEPLKKTYDEFKDLQVVWRNAGMVPRGEVNELWRNYHFLVEKFFDKVKINQELRDLGLKKNLQRKMELCEKAEELLIEEDVNKSFKLLQKYHQKWREVGAVPQDKNEETWQRFKSATDKINQRRRELYDEQNAQREENLKAKQALCEKLDELYKQERASVKDWLVATDKVNELFKLWRSIGRAPGKDNDKVWDQFKESLDKFFGEKKDFFKELKSHQRDNYNIKMEIIERAEGLKESEDWKGTKDELIKLQKEWKAIGPVPRKHSDKIWKRFRSACDYFFNRRDEFFKNVHQNEEENQKKKESLIEKVKTFELSGDKNEDIQQLKDFQREWSAIGFVPIKEKDKLQNAFKEVIDGHFDKLKVTNAEKNVMNFRQKLEGFKEDPNAYRKMGKERGFLMNKISKIEEDIQLWENNIGFLANSKKSNLLKDEFMKKIERSKQELVTMKSKLRYLDEANNE